MLEIKKLNILYERITGTKVKKSVGFEVIAKDKNGELINRKYYMGEMLSLEDAIKCGIAASPKTYQIVNAIGIVYFPITQTFCYLHDGDEVIGINEFNAKFQSFNSRTNNSNTFELDPEDSLLELKDYFVRQRRSER